MEKIEACRRHRRRGKGSRKTASTTIEHLQQGRVPADLHTAETHSFDKTVAQLESDAESSDGPREDSRKADSLTAGSMCAQMIASAAHEVFQVHHLLFTTSAFADHLSFKPPSPHPFPLLTTRADAPMLGAQARAAELAAASAAKQRQVSREIEERQLPPNPAVSLSAFTKTQSTTTRNKGNKTWKPLILDDIAESSDDASTSDPVVSTPSKADRITAKEASDKKIPTAPRAMVTDRSLSTVVACPQPPIFQPSPIIKMPTRRGDAGPCLLHHAVVGMPSRNVVPFEKFGSMMVPDDISPTKQEQKFSMLENVPIPRMMHAQELLQYRTTGADTILHACPFSQRTPLTFGRDQHGDPVSHGMPQTYGHDQPMWNEPSHDPYHPVYATYLQGQAQGLSHIYDNELDGGLTSAQMTQAPAPSSVPTPARFDTSANQVSIIPIRRDLGHPPTRESPPQYPQPYNTERAMKECVHKLKEKAKDGKTVLHNPEVHQQSPQTHITASRRLTLTKSTTTSSNNLQRSVPWEIQPKDSSQQICEWEVMPPPADQTSDDEVSFNKCQSVERSSKIKPAPGLPFPGTFGPPKLPRDNLIVPEVDASTAPQVGSVEWMRLAPITIAERDRVRRCMAFAAKSVTNETPLNNVTNGQPTENLADVRDWFHNDARGERLLRQQVSLSAQRHTASNIADLTARNGGQLPEHLRKGHDHKLAATLVLGNIACNLQTYLVGDRRSVEQRKNFHKVKDVPDWCTERGGMVVGGLGGGDSYFDGAAGGFFGAPVRVARDPRFRPQLKEGMKMNPEEEWKNRHEMYGRRVM